MPAATATLSILVRLIVPSSTTALTTPEIEAAAAAGASWFLDVELAGLEKRGRLDEDLRSCGADVRCAGARCEQHGIDRLLYVVVNLTARPGLMTIELLDSRARSSVATEVVVLQDQRLLPVESAVQAVLRSAGHRLGAKLEVDVAPADAQILLEPPGMGLLAPGTYRVIASRDGWTEQRQEIALAAGEKKRISLSLVEAPSIVGSWWLWTIVGAVVVGAAVAVGLAATRGDPTSVCHAREEGLCP